MELHTYFIQEDAPLGPLTSHVLAQSGEEALRLALQSEFWKPATNKANVFVNPGEPFEGLEEWMRVELLSHGSFVIATMNLSAISRESEKEYLFSAINGKKIEDYSDPM